MCRLRPLLIGAMMVAAVACGTGGVTGSPTLTPGPADDASVELVVQPGQFALVAPGQLCVAIVSVTGGDGPVVLRTSVSGDASVTPATFTLLPGEVADVTVVPRPGSIGTSLTLGLTAERGSRVETRSLIMEVVDWPDDLKATASELRSRFVAHLEANSPELGITSDTTWVPSITKPQILVVMHYLFFSDEWEMGITWHVTVPEYAWSRMYLRPRDGLYPTIGLEIPSWPDPASTPVVWEPPGEVDR